MGSGRKSFSAGHFDKREMKRMSGQSSRNYLTSEWITSLRQKGIIISDAEIRYRRWLALSSPSHSQKTKPHGPSRPRPSTAPVLPRANRSSKLRQQRLPEPLAEVNHTKIVQQKRIFDKHCRSFTPTTIRMDDVQLQDNSTPYQFLIGSRYNHSNIIDVRSLTRLGVYVPRENVGGAFINPAGIIPPTNTRYGRINDNVVSEDYTQRSSVLFDLQNSENISISSSVEGGIDSGDSSTDRHSEEGDRGPPSIHEGRPSINEGSINDDDLLCSSEATTLTMQILDELESMNHEGIKELANEIDPDHHHDNNDHHHDDNHHHDDKDCHQDSNDHHHDSEDCYHDNKDHHQDNNDHHYEDKDCQHDSNDHHHDDNHHHDNTTTNNESTSPVPTDNHDTAAVTMVTEGVGEEVIDSISKTSSSIVVDMTKLQI